MDVRDLFVVRATNEENNNFSADSTSIKLFNKD
nr:MAG TPA: hypothetical protein [Microviridae sp.]